MIDTLNSMFCINTHTHESQTLGLKVHTLYLTKRKKKSASWVTTAYGGSWWLYRSIDTLSTRSGARAQVHILCTGKAVISEKRRVGGNSTNTTNQTLFVVSTNVLVKAPWEQIRWTFQNKTTTQTSCRTAEKTCRQKCFFFF